MITDVKRIPKKREFQLKFSKCDLRISFSINNYSVSCILIRITKHIAKYVDHEKKYRDNLK